MAGRNNNSRFILDLSKKPNKKKKPELFQKGATSSWHRTRTMRSHREAFYRYYSRRDLHVHLFGCPTLKLNLSNSGGPEQLIKAPCQHFNVIHWLPGG